jgi:iron complex transport system permease protein
MSRSASAFIAALAALVAIVLVALCSGRYPISPSDVATILWGHLSGASSPSTADAVVWQIRLPRAGVASLTGAALASAGAAYQHLFRNPLVAPDTLGVSSGAALGAVVAIAAGASVFVVHAAAFAGGALAIVAVLLIATRLSTHEPLVTLILTGVVIASLFGAAISLVKYLADPYNQLPAITFWLLGSFAQASARDVASILPATVISLAALGLLAWRIDALSLSDDEARALGVDTKQLRTVVLAAATLATAASVAVSGIVGWIGLVVPHMARLIVGPNFARLLPIAALFGAAFTLAIDTIARVVAPIEVPPGIVTALVGTPVFIVLLARTRTLF